MNKLKDLEYEDFVNLVNYIYEITEDSEYKKEISIQKLNRFFPKLTAEQELSFVNICMLILEKDTESEVLFTNFKEEYPDIEIDPEGKSSPEKKNYWEIELKSLEIAYKEAVNSLRENKYIDTSLFKLNSQVYNAKTLKCLINLGKSKNQYIYNREIFLKKNSDTEFFNHKKFHELEEILKSINVSNELLNRVIDYCGKRKRELYYYFIKHLFMRLEILKYDPTGNNPINLEFIKNIKEID